MNRKKGVRAREKGQGENERELCFERTEKRRQKRRECEVESGEAGQYGCYRLS